MQTRQSPKTPITASYKPGTLVHTRGREWVVLPDSTRDLLMLRPVGGLDEEMAGILPDVEQVKSATLGLPSSEDVGDFASGRLLRDAARLSTRAAAGPFRSFGRIAVEPRPYQLVPLMMALKLDPVRLLIADDVGIGKTIEACLIARELLDCGKIRSLAVLCPPHLAEQWQRELQEKFHIKAELVLSSTIQRLERGLPMGESVFDRYPHTVVSTDFIKSSARRDDFILKCPEFVIVDEAHGCALASVGQSRQQRHELLREVAKEPRHLLLVTATPHSGHEGAFRSLLSLLNAQFADLPADLDREERKGVRIQLARHLVQRRRADIRRYLEEDTPFPDRKDKEATYTLKPDYRSLFDDILTFAREYVQDDTGLQRRRRVRYWSALALLRCVSSSPAAAAATLRNRAAVDEAKDVDEVGRRSVLDLGDDDDAIALDFSPGTDLEENPARTRDKLLEFARRAERLHPQDDAKFQNAARELRQLLKEGFRPIVFCRFLDTADYVARNLRGSLGSDVQVESVTGRLPPTEREARIESLAQDGKSFVLVCTDCLAEGINLQDHFDAVLHYDLAWNPTRHEQREGRVDRFGQKKKEVRVVTYYGKDNPIDGVILEALLRKHKSIKSDLGVTVSVPSSSEQIVETLFEGALFREQQGSGSDQLSLAFIDEFEERRQVLHAKWEDARTREKQSRTRFAQQALDPKPEVVAEELQRIRKAIGDSKDARRFFTAVLQGVKITEANHGITAHLDNTTPRSMRQAIGWEIPDNGKATPLIGRFELPLGNNETYLGRTSPIIERLASWALDQALDGGVNETDMSAVAARCGMIRTSTVTERTTLLVMRFRYQMSSGAENNMLCEEIISRACTGPADNPCWLTPRESEVLLDAHPEDNLTPTAVQQQLELLLPALERLRSSLEPIAQEGAAAQLDTHRRVRVSTGRSSIKPVLPVDILGAYLLLPRL